MRTKHVCLVMATLAIAGCSQNEIIGTAPDNTHPAIGFDVYTGVQTKGTEMTSTSMQTGGFGILAFKTTTSGWESEGSSATPGFMYNEQATYNSDGSSWTYTNTRFWPTNSDKLTFFAYAPYTKQENTPKIALSLQTATGAPEITFTQADAAADLVDLVVAEAKDQTYETNTSVNGQVKFTFSHVLTKINIKAKVDVSSLGSDTKVYIKELKLNGNGKLYKSAKYQMGTKAWDYTGATQWDNTAFDLDGILNKGTGSNWGYTQSGAVEIGTTAVEVFKKTNSVQEYLYLIPVDNATGTANADDANLTVKYDIVTKVSDSSNVTSTTKKTINLGTGALKQNTFATYTLKIGMNAITVDVDTSMDWGTTSENADIP